MASEAAPAVDTGAVSAVPLGDSTTPRSPLPRARILMVSASIGAGHDGAANELTRRLEMAGFVVDQVDFLDLLPLGLGRVLQRAYRLQLAVAPKSWQWLLLAVRHRSQSRLAGRSLARLSGRRTAHAISSGPWAGVVSTYPLASQMLGHFRLTGRLDAPLVTFLTDMSVHPMWVADGADAHLAMHPIAAEQARRQSGREVMTSGPAVRPAFRRADDRWDQRSARSRLGLPEVGPLALVVAGSWGVGNIERTARDIAASCLAVPVVACGTNAAVHRRLTASGVGIAMGWVDDMPNLIRACDVVVQNAGGLTSLEALASGVPVISYRCVPGHGHANADALDRAGWAPWISHRDDLATALADAVSADGPSRSPRFAPPEGDPAQAIAELATQTQRAHRNLLPA